MRSSSSITSKMSMDDMFEELDKYNYVKIPMFKNKYFMYQWIGTPNELTLNLFDDNGNELGILNYDNRTDVWELLQNKYHLRILIDPYTLKFK